MRVHLEGENSQLVVWAKDATRSQGGHVGWSSPKLAYLRKSRVVWGGTHTHTHTHTYKPTRILGTEKFPSPGNFTHLLYVPEELI